MFIYHVPSIQFTIYSILYTIYHARILMFKWSLGPIQNAGQAARSSPRLAAATACCMWAPRTCPGLSEESRGVVPVRTASSRDAITSRPVGNI